MTQADQLARALEALCDCISETRGKDANDALRNAREALAAYRAQTDKQGEAAGIFEGSFTGNLQGEAWLKVRSLGPIPEPRTKLYASPPQVAQPLAVEQIEALAHRIAWRYKKSSDPHHSDTYTFNKDALIQFAAAMKEQSR